MQATVTTSSQATKRGKELTRILSNKVTSKKRRKNQAKNSRMSKRMMAIVTVIFEGYD